MAKGYSNFTLKVEGVTFNGAKCSCPIIDIVGVGSDILPNCCYDEKKKEITGQIKDNPDAVNNSNCIDFWVKCSEDDCVGAKLITKCICTDNNQCGDCQECINGFCENRCEEGQFCDDDKCVDCLPGTCPDGKVCKNGKCVCPENTIEKDGRCIDCDPETFNVPCKECIDGTVVDTDCDKACDPATGDCVDCNATGDCNKENECCRNQICQCCPGYTRDNCTGECVVLPPNPCKAGESCGSCSDCINVDPCTGYGSCSDTRCPSGFVCYEGECIEECDCENPTCSSRTAYCGEVNLFQCGCFECPSNSCVEGDGSCEGSSNRRCTCNPSTQQCEPDPCFGVICPAGFICIAGRCVEQEEQCNSNLSLQKIEGGGNCDLKASLNLDCCPCPVIDVQITPQVNGEFVTFDAVFFKDGNRLGDNTATNNISGNEEPNFGNISYDTSYQNTTTVTNTDGFVVSESTASQTGPFGLSDSFDGTKDQLTAVAQIDATPGAILSTTSNPNGTTTTVSRSAIRFDIYLENTRVDGSGCTYRRQLIDTIIVDSADELLNIGVINAQAVSEDCANPLFVWSRDDIGKFRKIYIPSNGTLYEDTLFGPDSITNDAAIVLPQNEGELESCHTYTIEVDCDCEGPKSEYIVFCDAIDNFTAQSLNNCNTEVSYALPGTCDVNNNNLFEVVSNFGLEGSGAGSDLPFSTTISKATPIEFVTARMYCADGVTVACEKTFTFEAVQYQLEPVYNCPETITFPLVDSTGQVTVAAIYVNNVLLVGNTYIIPTANRIGGSIPYRIEWSQGCGPYESFFGWNCNCADNPCINQNCGSALDSCGNIIDCGNCPADSVVDMGCTVPADGTRSFRRTSFSCDGNGTCTPSVTTEFQVDMSCNPIVVPNEYDCISNSCIPVNGGQYSSLSACMAVCGVVTYNCNSGTCQAVNGNGGTYATLSECQTDCSLPQTGFCCENNVCTSNVLETVCTSGGGSWSAISCADAGCTTIQFGYECTLGDCTLVQNGQYSTQQECYDNTTCSEPVATGACCNFDGTCMVTTQTNCNGNSTYQGDNTTCAGVNCPSDCGCGVALPSGGCDCGSNDAVCPDFADCQTDGMGGCLCS